MQAVEEALYRVERENGVKVSVAAQNLLPGTQIFQEQQLMSLTSADIQKRAGRTKPKLERYLAAFETFQKVLTAKQQIAFLSLPGPVYPHFETALRVLAQATVKEDRTTHLNEDEVLLFMKVSCIERRNCFQGPLGDIVVASASLLKHSCAPNCYLSTVGNQCTCRVLQFVKAGEVLTANFKLALQLQSVAERRFHLLEYKEITCHCPRCDALGDDTRQFDCFDPQCNGRMYAHQPISDRQHQYKETQYVDVEYVEPHLLPCTVCQRPPPPEYQQRMLALEQQLQDEYPLIQTRCNKILTKRLDDSCAGQSALLRDIEALQYPPWHALGLQLAVCELDMLLDIHTAKDRRRLDRIEHLCRHIPTALQGILSFPNRYLIDYHCLVSTAYNSLSLWKPAEAKRHALLALRADLLMNGREREFQQKLNKWSLPRIQPPAPTAKALKEDQARGVEPEGAVAASLEEATSEVPALVERTDLCQYCEESPERAALTLRLCGGCGQVAYCSRGCQKAHWKLHKTYCGK